MITLDEYKSILLRRVKPDVSSNPNAVDCEADLHAEIIEECKRRQWIVFHGSMAHRAMRTPGEPDFVILAEYKKVYLIECKSKTGKLTTEQLGIAMWSERLGHKVHVVRSMAEFLEVVKQ